MAKKKKQSKLRRIVSALNPTNPKGMALLFALIFALSGAGVYLYQSFAATTAKYTYIAGPASLVRSTDTRLVHDTVLSAKSGANTVVQIYSPGHDVVLKETVSDYINYYYPSRPHRVCAYARKTSNSSSVRIRIQGMSSNSVTVSLTTSYQKYCTGLDNVPLTNYLNPWVNTTDPAAEVNVAKVSIEVF